MCGMLDWRKMFRQGLGKSFIFKDSLTGIHFTYLTPPINLQIKGFRQMYPLSSISLVQQDKYFPELHAAKGLLERVSIVTLAHVQELALGAIAEIKVALTD